MPVKQAQLMDVAMRAKVAKSTVAAALRPGGGGKNARVSEKTAARICQIAAELGYRPNRLASGLRGASTSSVAAVWQFVDPWCLDANIGNQLLQRFQHLGLATYQAEHPNDPGAVMSVLTDLLERRPDALIIRWRPDQIDHAGIRALIEQFSAVVAVVPWQVTGLSIDQVVHDRSSGIRQVVRHFAQTGRKRLCITLNMQDVTDRQKFDVFASECRANGLEVCDRTLLDLSDRFSNPADRIERYLAAMKRHFAGAVDVDAILCVNDVGMMAVAKDLRDRGLRVGREVALVGLNDPPGLSLWDPPLATIDRNHGELLDAVYGLVTDRLASPTSPPQARSVNMRFVWRESAGGTGDASGGAR